MTIPDGLLYVGNNLNAVGRHGVEPALIDPRLPIQSLGAGEDMPYWPNYSEISPASRGAYLRWLAGGRRLPGASLGLVFLFFYGLERRILAEKEQVSIEEWEQIRSEVLRLIGIYGQNSSFRGYAEEFLGILSSVRVDAETLAGQVPEVTRSWQSANLPLKVGLGWMAKNGRPIPANWALAWVRSNDSFNERTAAIRCRSEFEKLFAIRYRELYGDGLIVNSNKARLKAGYKPASASFQSDVTVSFSEFPDITVLKRPMERLLLLAEGTTDDLDSYSRYLGRNPDSSESVAALSLLPHALIETSGHPVLARIGAWIRSLHFENGLAVTSYGKLREVWPSLPESEIGKRDAVMLSQCLARLGYGLEPDIRFGVHLVKVKSLVVLFALSADSPSAPSAPYTSATLLSHLGAAMAHADDQISVKEEQALMAHASQALELTAPERVRLQAHTKWLLLAPPETTGLKKRIELLSQNSRAVLGAFLARLVGLDGSIAPSEITALQKFYRQLGLDPKSVFSDAHDAATEPVRAQLADPVPTFDIPKRPTTARGRPRVDLDRVRAMEIESERVSVLLREIFAGEEGEITTVSTLAENPVVVKVCVLDLDDVHSQVVLTLFQRAVWTRAELEGIAAKHSLMPDGAIDTINEAALNLHGEPLLEGEDPLEVNLYIRSVIQP